MPRPVILVVDDSSSVREILRIHLSNAGYEVLCAEDAVEAGRAVLKAAPDLMVTNVTIPYMSGLELVEAMKGDPSIPDFPVVFLTSSEETAEEASRLRPVACLTKPVSAERLLEVVALHVAER